jgi:hypothetical protein
MTTQENRPRRGFLRWLRDLMLGPRDESVPTRVDLVVSEYRAGTTIEVPAEGGVYHFTVNCDFTWSARGMTRATLISWIGTYQESADRALRDTVWSVARTHLPSQPEAAEAAMNDALRDGWCFGEPGEVVACAAVVRVVADSRVLDCHLPLWQQLVEYDLHYRVEHRRIDHLVELLTRWRDVLDDFGESPVVIQAATLTDAELATAIDGLARRRYALGEHLVAVLEKTRDAHGQVGLFELAKSYDVAVRNFERQAGLDKGTVSVGVDGDA